MASRKSSMDDLQSSSAAKFQGSDFGEHFDSHERGGILKLATLKRKPVDLDNTHHKRFHSTGLESNNSTETQPLVHNRHSTQTGHKSLLAIPSLTADILLVLLPVMFIGLAIAASAVDGQPKPNYVGEAVLETTKLAPTIFPVIFAAIVGRLMRSCGQWSAARGAKLGLLEQLNGSQTFLTALKLTFRLQQYGVISLAIVSLWTLGPLGGQSSLRVLSLTPSNRTAPCQIMYLDPHTTATRSAFTSDKGVSEARAPMTAVLQASMLTKTTRYHPQDIWGNVKIPVLERLPSFEQDTIQNQWHSFNPANDTGYASLTGIKFAGLSANQSTNFTFTSSYLNLACADPSFFPVNDTSPGFQSFVAALGSVGLAVNWDYPFANSTLMLNTRWRANETSYASGQAINLLYTSVAYHNSSWGPIMYDCNLTRSFVDSRVICDGYSCRILAMRMLAGDSLWPGVASPNPDGTASTPFGRLLTWLPLSMHDPYADNHRYSPIVEYVTGGDDTFLFWLSRDSDYTNITSEMVSERFVQIFNAAWQISFAPRSIIEPSSAEFSNRSFHRKENWVGTSLVGSTLNATVLIPIERYVASRLWVVITMSVSAILLVCGVATLTLKRRNTVPDIMGYVSSMTRDNLYFDVDADVDQHAHLLNGLERAKIFRNVRVQLADVRPWEENGYIALRSLPTVEESTDEKR